MRRLALATAMALVAAGTARAGDTIYYRHNPDGTIELTNVPTGAGLTPVRSTMHGVTPGSGAKYREMIFRTAREHGVHPDLAYAVAAVESSFDPQARSPKGALGLMQLMPDTAERFGVTDPFDPAENVRGGVRFLRYLLDLFGGDVRLALAAYNAGENAVLATGRVPPYQETRTYVAKIIRRFGPGRAPWADGRPPAPEPAPPPEAAQPLVAAPASETAPGADTAPPPPAERPTDR
jgi:soluble lytic murein transglycosylase-like protein